VRELLAVMKALADPNRLRIVAALDGRELCLCQIVELLGLATSTVSRHMSILEQARLVDARKDGRWTYFRLAQEDARPEATEAAVLAIRALAEDRLACEDAHRLKQILKINPEDLCRRLNEGRSPVPMKKILFLCTGNSCRSQMAEGWARHLKRDVIEPYSAGIETHGMNPYAVRVMAEAGVDLSGQRSKHVRELGGIEFDYVVTVCGHAHESCPVFPGKVRVVHRGFDDPPRLAATAQTEEEKLGHYRRVRDEIKAFVETLPESLNQLGERPA
jgi:arsenate reductase